MTFEGAPYPGKGQPGSAMAGCREPEGIVRVLVNARYLANPTTGIETVLRSFLNAFRGSKSTGGFTPVLLAPPAGEYGEFDAIGRGRAFSGAPSKALFDLYGAGRGFDDAISDGIKAPTIFFGPSYAVPMFCHHPRVSYAHDLAFLTHPSCYDASTVAYCLAAFLPSVLAAEAVVTNSEATAAEIRALPGIASEGVFVAPPPLGEEFARHSADPSLTASLAVDPATGKLLEDLGVRGPYVLSVSTIQPRKNQARLLKAFAALPPDVGRNLYLVLAGRPAWKTGEFTRTMNSLSPSTRARVLLAGQVSSEAVMRLLSRARCLAYPSLAEGFGIPALEAMAMGIPVVSGNSPAPREVCGPAVIYADPLDVGSISAALERAVADETERQRLSIQGRVRAACFTRERFLEGLFKAFEYASRFTG